MLNKFDIIVVGAGHAGCEAAAAAAKLGSNVLLVSLDLEKTAQMSCNPAMGGVGKGQILREIDAIGGLSGVITDQSTIQFKMLNRSKGPAMWSPRAQCDRFHFSKLWRKYLEAIPNLYFWQDNVTSLLISGKRVIGVKTQLGIEIHSNSVILTNGTFLTGKIHVGDVNFGGGRIGEGASVGLTQQLKELGFSSGRMKTGTPVRIDGRTVNYEKLIEQKGEENHSFFSYTTKQKSNLKQRSCFIAHTNETAHNILKKGFDKSPLFQGQIEGIGPRYCPSIEDKLRTFAKKNVHQLFLEPEGEKTYEMYLNGFSSSLPANVQYEALKAIEGFENVHILRPGYAIEYDFFPPEQLHHTLQTKIIDNLFFAGQINGTTGYEEAAAQGLIAGINAHLSINSKEPLTLSRDQAYIGVLIDDLVTKGVDEPYRMFTSRAEHRILLRQDNADQRLTHLGKRVGLVTDSRLNEVNEKYTNVEKLINRIRTTSVTQEQVNPYLRSLESKPLSQTRKLIDVALRPEVNLSKLLKIIDSPFEPHGNTPEVSAEIIEAAEIRIKYGGYIEREQQVAEKMQRLEYVKIPSNFDYSQLKSISTEARQKLSAHAPKTIGEARRLPGVTPSDINVLLIYFGR